MSGQDEQRELDARMVVMSAESAATSARFEELAEQQRGAWRRHRAAKGLVTRAQRDGDAARIAAAVERERAAYEEADRIAAAGIREMSAIHRNGTANIGAVLDQMPRTPAWQPLEQQAEPDREAGQ